MGRHCMTAAEVGTTECFCFLACLLSFSHPPLLFFFRYRQPLYISLILTSTQVALFLCIFECVRRRETKDWTVYDRRRRRYPDRTPPPLMKRRGLLNGWLAFEWYRIRVSDEDYLAMSKEESRKEEANIKVADKQEKQDSIIVQAERKCYLESPFAQTGDSDNYQNGIEMVYEDNKDHSSEKTPPMETVTSEVDDAEQHAPEAETSSHVSATSGRHPSLQQDKDERQPRSGKEVSFEIEGDIPERQQCLPSSRRSMTSLGSDAPWGSEEAERLARLRYETRDEIHWDTQLIRFLYTRGSAFLRFRILQLRRGVPESNFEGANTSEERADKAEFMANRVVRRPLTTEQQEVLRCIGLDAFMTLRFLRFGFDVSIWSFLLSLVSIIPIYRAQRGQVEGFYSITAKTLDDETGLFWVIMFFAFIQYLYILRRLWIEWELFLPLRYDFLEHGDFRKEKYRKQYQATCLVEYVPKSQKRSAQLLAFFDAMFPGQVRRAEVLLNTEYLRSLIRRRLDHIIKYEDIYAKKVHRWAVYMRKIGRRKSCCGKGLLQRRPEEPKCVVVHQVPREDSGNAFFNPYTKLVKDPRTYPALQWHHE